MHRTKTSTSTRWHLLYFLFAGFDIAAICASLFLSQANSEQNAKILDTDQEFITLMSSVNSLARIASQANAPGNDIFETKDLPREESRFTQSSEEFHKEMARLQSLIQVTNASWPYSRLNLASVESLRRSSEQLTSELFRLFRSPGGLQKAAKQMALMDRGYAELLTEIDSLRTQLIHGYQLNLAEKKTQLHASQRIFYLISFLVALAFIGSILYGSRLSRFFRTQSQHDAGLLEQQQQLAHQLKQANQQLDYVLECAGMGAWDWCLETNEVSFDRRLSAMIGLQHESAPQDISTWESKVHPEDLTKSREAIQAHLHGKTPLYENIHRMRHADGSWIWILARGKISEWNADGKPTRFTGVHFEITQYKESEELSKSIQKIANIGGWELDVSTQKRKWAEQTYKILAVPPDTPTDTINGIEFFPPHERPRLSQCVQKCLEGVPYRETFELIDAKGQHKWVESMGEPLFDSHGKVYKLRGTIQDVTESVELRRLSDKKHRETLEAQARVDGVLEHSPATVYECLPNENWTVTFISPHIARISGYPASDFIQDRVRSYASIIHPEDSERVGSSVHEAIAQERAYEIEYRILNREGQIRWVWERGSLSQSSGQLFGVLLDITEQKTTREALERASKEMDQFFSVSLDLLCIAGFDGKFKKLNPAFSTVLGYPLDELKSKPFFEFIHRDDVESTSKEFEKLSTGIPTLHFENRYRCFDGSYKILSWSASPDPATGLIYAAARDVTDARQRERELQQVLKAIEQSAIVATTDPKGKILTANDIFCRISGYSRKELIGNDHRILNSGAHSKEFMRNLWKTISSGQVWSGEFQNRSKDKRIYYVASVISPIKDLNGRIERYLSIRFDVTEQKLSSKRFEEAQRVGKIGSWTYEVQSGKIHWSRQMFEMFPEDPSRGAPSFERHYSTIHPEDQSGWKATVEECLSTGKPYRMRFRSIFPDGRSIWIVAHGEAKKDNSGKVTELSGTCQDISELVRAEESLQAERAKAMHAAKLASLGEMAAGIAHEINNPLAIISTAIHVLRHFQADSAQFENKCEVITKATDRIAKIVGGLRKFSRTSQAADYKPESLADLLHEVFILTEAKAKRYYVPVELSIEAIPLILCDGMEIEQVLVNLINNGIDAARNLPDKWVKVRLFEEGPEAVIQVVDSGSGIPPEIEQKLFQPFFTTKEIGEGTGLGLSISKGILDQHQATLSLNRKLKNTCFEIRFRLPQAREAAA